jgi:hypothetical protein
MQLQADNTKRPRLLCGYKWKDITHQEIMTYFGILMYAMLYPQTGRRIRDNAWTPLA